MNIIKPNGKKKSSVGNFYFKIAGIFFILALLFSSLNSLASPLISALIIAFALHYFIGSTWGDSLKISITFAIINSLFFIFFYLPGAFSSEKGNLPLINLFFFVGSGVVLSKIFINKKKLRKV